MAINFDHQVMLIFGLMIDEISQFENNKTFVDTNIPFPKALTGIPVNFTWVQKLQDLFLLFKYLPSIIKKPILRRNVSYYFTLLKR